MSENRLDLDAISAEVRGYCRRCEGAVILDHESVEPLKAEVRRLRAEVERLTAELRNERDMLTGYLKRTREEVEEAARAEYARSNKSQRLVLDGLDAKARAEEREACIKAACANCADLEEYPLTEDGKHHRVPKGDGRWMLIACDAARIRARESVEPLKAEVQRLRAEVERRDAAFRELIATRGCECRGCECPASYKYHVGHEQCAVCHIGELLGVDARGGR